MDNRPIGIFDSGVGGLTVVREVMKTLPREDIVYFGDTARVPYGSKSKETICRFSAQIADFLISKNVKAIVIACNTSATNSYDYLTERFPIPFIEVTGPGVDACLKLTRSNTVGVIGTEATIRSGAYERLLKERRPGLTVYSKACPLFVPLAEEGWTDNEPARLTAELYLRELLNKNIDCLVLGCTHYPMLTACIRGVVGGVNIINPAIAAAAETRKFLEREGMLGGGAEPSRTFYVSDNTSKFGSICKLLLEREYEAVKVDIEAY